jgi:hypothetical protein
MQLNRNLKFDPVKQVFINDDEANKLAYQGMRAPYSI